VAQKVNKKYRVAFIAVIILWFIGLLVYYLHNANFAVLDPKGLVAFRERKLMITTVVLGLFVLLPVFIMTALIAWRYREGNTKAKYSPNLAGNRFAETLWWGIPSVIIFILSVITWNSSHELDPRAALHVSGKPMTIQVVALDWKWLFIYPEQHLASVNYAQLPVGRPVSFEITADAPMNSFWIPQLGSQIYAMPGMVTHLHLIADKPGSYAGSSANLSGKGFASMRFEARAGTDAEFGAWMRQAQQTPSVLDLNTYDRLAKPSVNNRVEQFSTVDARLYASIVNKYMIPGTSNVR
jgi:cytochrome o ubiquinol oxidase subunit 2